MRETQSDRDLDSTALLKSFPDPIDRVFAVLNRSVNLDVLGILSTSLQSIQAAKNPSEKRSLMERLPANEEFVLGFDTNAFFRLGLGSESAVSTLDYITGAHHGPVILPGQVIQESWNNAHAIVTPTAKRVQSALTTLDKEITKAGFLANSKSSNAWDEVNEYSQTVKQWIDPESHAQFIRTVSAISGKASCKFVPRERFIELARLRNDTKTPPGFEDPDNNHGDFFVWADYLYGLASADLTNCTRVVFVTKDQKADWSTNEIPHPILTAEAQLLTGLPFELCSLKEFQEFTVARAS